LQIFSDSQTSAPVRTTLHANTKKKEEIILIEHDYGIKTETFFVAMKIVTAASIVTGIIDVITITYFDFWYIFLLSLATFIFLQFFDWKSKLLLILVFGTLDHVSQSGALNQFELEKVENEESWETEDFAVEER